MKRHFFLPTLALALAFALVAATEYESHDCDVGSCSSGQVIQQKYYTAPNCTGSYALFDLVPANPANCSLATFSNVEYGSVERACSAATGFEARVYDSDYASCNATYLIRKIEASAHVCISSGSESYVYWCDIAFVKNGTIPSSSLVNRNTPSSRALASTTFQGHNFTDPCSSSGCGSNIATTYYYNAEGCPSKNFTVARPATLGATATAFQPLDTCIVASWYSTGNNVTSKMTCSNGQVVLKYYQGDCVDSALFATYSLPTDQCAYTYGQWSRTICPGTNSAAFMGLSGSVTIAVILVLVALLV